LDLHIILMTVCFTVPVVTVFHCFLMYKLLLFQTPVTVSKFHNICTSASKLIFVILLGMYMSVDEILKLWHVVSSLQDYDMHLFLLPYTSMYMYAFLLI
jgi:hypothetical protein